MTGRERWIKLLKGEKIDRVLINPFIWINSVYEFFKHEPKNFDDFLNPENFDLNKKSVEYFEYFNFDIRYHSLPIIYNNFCEKSDKNGKWVVTKKNEINDEKSIEITTIKTPEKELRQIKSFKHPSKYLWIEAPIEYFIKDSSDLNQFIKYQPSFIEKNIDLEIIKRAKSAVGDKGILSILIPGAYVLLSAYRKLDLLLMDPLLDRSFYMEAMDHFINNILKIYVKKIAEAGADLINIAGNVATGSAVGPKYFCNYVFEYEKQIVDLVHSLGKFVTYHNCGDTKGLLGDIYNGLRLDAFETLTPPPYGDTIFEEALEKFDRNVVLFGNIDQVTFLREANPAEVKNKVKDIVIKGKNRGNFVLSTSDYFLDGTPYDNIRAFVEAGLEYGQY